ncbi:tRNA lysidine(34) synthetase TilS [Fructilactobacillus hinvesii]|uniref:tRNA(Ile)-lysidine synthase n=1 Tax=Fructilactobacillus hinvesii TaxID=2940300 RepID=A0ABY5BU97_9LACO|nr:tRNA lysidine(34) synthetase TilS [Fructilactobacillus hinvesii]USS87871.1 tRNA lysidine(34) synthetase TilS [Fructilactobacillus hinvesii]
MTELEQRVRQILTKASLTPGAPLIVAVSGGVDSMVLLHLLERVARPDWPLLVAHVNHQLRPQSRAEEDFLRRYCGTHHLPIVVFHWEHASLTRGVEEQARMARYAFFHRLVAEHQAAAVILAHHQNDQAETVLMRLTRSADVFNATAMRSQRPFFTGQLLRPLLDVPKRELVRYARFYHLTWFEDQTNQTDAVSRNRVRHHVLPALERENPQAGEHLAHFASNLQRLEKQYQLLSDRLIDQERLWQTGEELTYQLQAADEPVLPSLLQALWRRLFPTQGLPAAKLQELLTLVQNPNKPQGELDLGQQWQFQKRYQLLRFQKKSDNLQENPQAIAPFMVVLNHWYELPLLGQFGVFQPDQLLPTDVTYHSLWLTEAQLPLRARLWQATDRVALPKGHSQRVRRVLIDQKVPRERRSQCLVLETATHVVQAVLGYKVSFQTPPETAQQYRLVIKHERKNDERRYPNNFV